MSTAGCQHWQGALAVDALGGLEPEERAGLEAHLDGCASCRALAVELRATAGALAHASIADLAPTGSVPPKLTERVLGALHDDATASRRHRRLRTGAVALAATAIAASLVLLLALPSPTATPSSRRAVLTGAGHATATVVMTARTWGTAIAFTEQGLPVGAVYQVAMRTTTGTWWTTGSVQPRSSHAGPAQMSCYVPLRDVTGIRVTDGRGTPVLETVAGPGSGW